MNFREELQFKVANYQDREYKKWVDRNAYYLLEICSKCRVAASKGETVYKLGSSVAITFDDFRNKDFMKRFITELGLDFQCLENTKLPFHYVLQW